MNKYTLSILIPSRNEEFLARTIQDIIEHKRGDTEVIVGLDGQWANPPIDDHPDLTLVYYPESIGQRGMTNQLCKISQAKYVMKCDAHVSFAEGFDVELVRAMKELGDNTTLAPTMRNLHAFDWLCPDGHRRYQGPSGPCREKVGGTDALPILCGKETKKDVVWIAKTSPQSNSFCFDSEPHFQYFNEYCKRPEGKEKNGFVETMSLQGSCFLITREKYWELKLGDETWGSWGSQGIQLACSTWLSGGRVIIDKNTFYAHMFRTQGLDFSFPYPQSGRQVERTKKYAKDLLYENKFPKQIYPSSWLIDRFKPVKGWHDDTPGSKEALKKITDAAVLFTSKKDTSNITDSLLGVGEREIPSRSIIFYTDCQLNLKIAHMVQRQLRMISTTLNIPIFSSSLKPMSNMGTNVYLPLKRSILTYFKQVMAVLEASNTDIVYFCEHDVLYSPSHFDFIPPRKDKFYYNLNVWRWKYPTDWFVSWEAEQVAEMCCYRDLALNWYRNKLKEIESGVFDRSYEPGSGNKELYEDWKSLMPNIDIRHGTNLTKSKWSIADFRDKSSCINWKEGTIEKVEGWINLRKILGL